MIIVKLMGGLGNQMFQYATGLSLSRLHNTELLIDPSFLNKDPKGAYTKRYLELDVFNLKLNIASEQDIMKFKINRSNKYTRTLQRHFPILFSYLYVAEKGNAYQKEFLNFPKNTYLEGFWQSEKYFKEIESVLVKEFIPRDELNIENNEWLNKISRCESVSLHIRRGDYVLNKNAHEHHGILDLSYYKSALDFIKEKNSNMEVFVFSDDLEWCKENLKFDYQIHFVDANQKSNFHCDLFLMSHCKHNVIANSSFSWWGAWLNQNPKKNVIASKKWYSDRKIQTDDLIPPNWIRL